ncbi:MAG: 2-hydroxychromene-2-carboxylate isomerase [Pseudomonadota bacterium]
MSKTVEFIFDFGSPNAYFAYRALTPVLERTGARLKVIPCLLGGIFKATGNQPPMMAFNGVKGKLEYDRLEIERFIRKHQLDRFVFNPNFPVNTLMLMRGAIAAEAEGKLDAYLEAGLVCMWEKGLKMDDPEVFAAGLTDAGLDGAAILERTSDPEVKAALAGNTAAAVERGVFGIPTFFVGDEMFFGKDRLQQVEEELMA